MLLPRYILPLAMNKLKYYKIHDFICVSFLIYYVKDQLQEFQALFYFLYISCRFRVQSVIFTSALLDDCICAVFMNLHLGSCVLFVQKTVLSSNDITSSILIENLDS